ncbi:MAG: endo-1,4-beta-xylanase, partial [Armatimonadota bacterium]|nr:endo-1,4-beta-xylanase [Armatimonadota bacterium]
YFGCNSFGHPARGPEYDRRFKEIFNFGIAHLYLSHYAPAETVRNFDRTDVEVEWLLSMGMGIKLCPPFYLASSVTPEWLKNKTYSQIRRAAHELVKEVCARYAGRVQFCEIVNEAHDYSNSLRLKPEELTNLAKVCSKAAREGDPNVQRIINCCHLWGEYAAKPAKLGPPKRSPYAYLRDCIKYGVEFEIVGLQMYYPEYDLFEIDRLLDRYAKLGKPIHITEMGCSSAPGIDPNGQRKKASAGWHGDWTEDMQADWVEAIYTLCYSKPYIKAICWWDLADAVSFWPYGGLLRADCSPKPAYIRLKALLEKWGFAEG